MKFLVLTILSLTTVFSLSSFAGRQMELPFAHPDEVLIKTGMYSENKELVSLKSIPANVRKMADSIDTPFELGDGYYGVMASAVYRVFDNSGTTVGYMFVDLLSYTEDPQFYLVATYVNTLGIRVGEIEHLNMYFGKVRDIVTELPEELASQINLSDYE